VAVADGFRCLIPNDEPTSQKHCRSGSRLTGISTSFAGRVGVNSRCVKLPARTSYQQNALCDVWLRRAIKIRNSLTPVIVL
jgi:hypothetical protein